MSHSAPDEELRNTCESTVMTQLLYSRELNNDLYLLFIDIMGQEIWNKMIWF